MLFPTSKIPELLVAMGATQCPTFKIPLSASLLASMRARIVGDPLPIRPATHLIVGSIAWSLVIVNKDFQSLFDPALKHEDVANGYFGNIIGLDVIGDAFFEPDKRFVDPRCFAVASFDTKSEEVKLIDCVACHVC